MECYDRAKNVSLDSERHISIIAKELDNLGGLVPELGLQNQDYQSIKDQYPSSMRDQRYVLA